MSTNYQVVPVNVPTGQQNSFVNNATTYGAPIKQMGGIVAGDTERFLRKQVGEWARFILMLLAWLGMVGFVALLIWIVVIIAKSPNNPPIEAVQLIPGLVSVIAVSWVLMMIETKGRIKFYIYTGAALLTVLFSLIIIILWYVYFTSFIFTCKNPDPATLAVFLCQAGEAENTEYASFAFSIVGIIMTVVVLPLVPIVGILSPPKDSSLTNETNMQYWFRELNVPTTKPRITVPNLRGYFPSVTRRNRYTQQPEYEAVVPVSARPPNPWNTVARLPASNV